MNKPALYGGLASATLSAFYFATVSIIQSFPHAVETFSSLWYFMVPLIAGFGVQVGLFSRIRSSLRASGHGSSSVQSCGGLSAASMVACCAHHVTDVIPVIGVTAVATVLVQYQPFFILLGILSNAVGITVMLNVIQAAGMPVKSSVFRTIMRFNLRKARNFTIAFSALILLLSLLAANPLTSQVATPTLITPTTQPNTPIPTPPLQTPTPTSPPAAMDLPSRTIEHGGVSFEIVPVEFSFDREVKFKVSMDTHSGSLDFDLTKTSILEDSRGIIYSPVGWDGSPTGGHHTSGMLTFPKLLEKSDYLKLILKGIHGEENLVFLWDLLPAVAV